MGRGTGEGVIVAIDQGTTGSRVIVYDASGAATGSAYQEFTQHYPRPAWVEHDASEIWDGVRGLLARALEAAGVEGSDVRAIGLTNQRETAVLWDRGTGDPVSRAIVWQDRRTAGACDALRAEGLEGWFRERTGLPIDAYFSATKVSWVLDQDDDLRRRAERGEIAFGTIDSWLLWRLTGGAVHATDVSNASRTMLFNIHGLEWDDEILSRLRIPRELLPEVVPSSGVMGELETGLLGRAIPVAGMAGDQQAALFGQACYARGDAKNTYGTGSFTLMHTGTEAVASERLVTTVAWRIGEEPAEYALEGSIFVTGAAVQWLRDGLGIIDDAAETEHLARSVGSNDGVYFVPALTGLGAPYWDAAARGTILGLTRGTTRAHLARAALESMAYQTRDVIDAMREESGVELKTLRADGGAVANTWLMQFQADVLGTPVEVPRVHETTSLGAAYLAGLAVGYWPDREALGRVWARGARYEPSMAPGERDRLLARWRRAVERARAWESE